MLAAVKHWDAGRYLSGFAQGTSDRTFQDNLNDKNINSAQLPTRSNVRR